MRRRNIDRYSADSLSHYRPTIDRLSTDYRPTIDRPSTDYRPTIDRLSTAISTAMSTDISVDITHRKQVPVKIRIHHHTRSRTLYKLIYREIFYPAFFPCACERSFETASFCLKFSLFSSRRARKLILSIFSKSKRPFEKQTTPRLVTHLCLSMDKIWAKMIFWLWPWNFDFARFLQTFALKTWTHRTHALIFGGENFACPAAD